jgi:hypothetical protein
METKGIIKKKNYKDIEKANEKKFSKFHNISKLIVGKVDDILGNYNPPVPGYASAIKNNFSDSINYGSVIGLSNGLSKNISDNKELNLNLKLDSQDTEDISVNSKVNYKENKDYKNLKKNTPSEKSLPSISRLSSKRENNIKSIKDKIIREKKTVNNNNTDTTNSANKYNSTIPNIEKSNKEFKEDKIKENKIIESKNKNKETNNKRYKNKDIDKEKDSEINNNKNNPKNVFLTKVEIEGKIKSSSEEKKNYEEDLMESSTDEENIITNIEPKKVDDFRYMIEEIESLKQGAKNEYDELQYLIKYVGKASTRVNRHMYGVSNLFKESGINTKTANKKNINKFIENSDDDNSDNNSNRNYELYNKEKNMGRIKDNLINMQDNFIGFYKNFDSKMKNIEINNKKFKNKILYDKTKK